MPPDWKPPARIVDPKAGIAKLRTEGRCRVCGRVPPGLPLDGLTRFHIVSKAQRGDDVDANLVPVCGSGWTGCHGILDLRRDSTPGDPCYPLTFAGAARRLRGALHDDERAYVLGRKGEAWLDWRLPS